MIWCVWYGIVLYSMACYDVVWYGMMWCVWYGIVLYSMACCDVVWYTSVCSVYDMI